MSYRVIRRDACQPVEWKNGAGWTRNLCVHPAGSDMDSFDWRVSIASLEKAAPYSVFSGVDRIQLLLRGQSLSLKKGNTLICLALYQMLEFSGDDLIESEPEGVCEVLNIMSRRGKYQTDLNLMHGAQKVHLSDAHYVLYVVADVCGCHFSDGTSSVLSAGDVLHIIGDGDMLELTAKPDAVTALIKFSLIQD